MEQKNFRERWNDIVVATKELRKDVLSVISFAVEGTNEPVKIGGEVRLNDNAKVSQVTSKVMKGHVPLAFTVSKNDGSIDTNWYAVDSLALTSLILIADELKEK